MDFIDLDGALKPVRFAAPFHPFLVLPLMAAQVVDNGCGPWREFCVESNWVGLLNQLPGLGANAVFIRLPRLNIGNRSRPNSFMTGVEIKCPMRPVVSVVDDANFPGIRCPDGEAGSSKIPIIDRMGSQPLIYGAVHPAPHCGP